MAESRFERLKNPSSFRRISIADWKAPNDPTVYFSFPLDFSKGQHFLNRVNASSEHKVTPTHLVAKVLALTLRHYPELNGIIRWGQIYLRKSVDIFLQVAIMEENSDERPDLSGAKIDSCDSKTLAEIASELKEKSRAIRSKKDPQFKSTIKLLNLTPPIILKWGIRFLSFLIFNFGLRIPKLGLPTDPFGSAMITSVGTLKLASGFPPLVPMSRCPLIVCVGQVMDRPVVIDGEIVARPILDLSVTFDHRFIDGLSGARMAQYFKQIIENPEEYLT